MEDDYDQWLMVKQAKNYRQERHYRIRGAIAWLILVLYIFLAPHCGKSASAEERPKEKEAIRLSPYPPIQLWRRGVQIRTSVFIEPNASNHCVELQWRFTWPGGGGSSTWEIDDSSQRQFVRYISHGTPGTVWFVGILHRIENGKDVYIRVEREAILAGEEE